MEEGPAVPLPTLEPISRPSSTATTASEAIAQLPSIQALATGGPTISSPQPRLVAKCHDGVVVGGGGRCSMRNPRRMVVLEGWQALGAHTEEKEKKVQCSGSLLG
jgi:hypothetical protein